YQVNKTNKSAIKYILFAFFLVAIIVFFLWDSLPIGSKIDLTISSFQAYISGENKITSLGERLEMWRASWYAFLQKPLFGWGWSNSDVYFSQFREQGIIALNRNTGHPHNQYLLFISELGILGFTAFMVMLLYPIQYFIRKISSFNALGDNNGAFICLLPIILYEAILEFSLTDDSLSQRHFILIMTIITIFSFTFVTKIENKNTQTSNGN
ncbi:MAG: O-antigen ligase family protein, partial [Desulfobacteraceae bacterium]|nr:O-antigen ligase family protein [Desulfobacteraceae bacterium]